MALQGADKDYLAPENGHTSLEISPRSSNVASTNLSNSSLLDELISLLGMVIILPQAGHLISSRGVELLFKMCPHEQLYFVFVLLTLISPAINHYNLIIVAGVVSTPLFIDYILSMI